MGGFVLYLGNYVVYNSDVGGFVLYLDIMLYRIRVWECLFSIWVIMLYRIRVWEGLFSI